jgi:hypothetical protein
MLWVASDMHAETTTSAKEWSVRKTDYYAAPEPWKMPKWVAITIGTLFASVAFGAGLLVVYLTRTAHAQTPPAVAASAVSAPSIAAPAPALENPPAPSVASAPAKHGRPSHHATMRPSHANAAGILARHDSKEKRRQKDQLDKMLGL